MFAVQRMIMAGGPVETAFTVYSDFENYAGGIYHHVTGSEAGGHAVKIVGWGVEDGVKYWKIAKCALHLSPITRMWPWLSMASRLTHSSWNPYWGEDGYFRMIRGTNEGGIEDQVVGSSAVAEWSRVSLVEA